MRELPTLETWLETAVWRARFETGGHSLDVSRGVTWMGQEVSGGSESVWMDFRWTGLDVSWAGWVTPGAPNPSGLPSTSDHIGLR